MKDIMYQVHKHYISHSDTQSCHMNNIIIRPTFVCLSVSSVVIRCIRKMTYIKTLKMINPKEDLLRKRGLSKRKPAT